MSASPSTCRRARRARSAATSSAASSASTSSADGRTILGHTGGPDPTAQHDVVTVPYRSGGKLRVLVKNAGYPDWSR